MRPKFSKALLCAGLAAALVGCGGGSSTTTMDNSASDSGPVDPPARTPAEVAANTVQQVYDRANAQVTGLTVDSSTSDIADARTAVSDLRKVLSTPNLSSEKTEEFNAKAMELSAMITQKETDIGNAKTRRQNELSMMAKTNSWMAGTSNPTLSDIGMWPTDAIGAGVATPVEDVRTGWDVHGYEYTKGGMDEHGKTFKMEKTSTTSEVKVDWKILATHQSKDPEVFLGKKVEMYGSLTDDTKISSHVAISYDTTDLVGPGKDLDANQKFTTRIHKDHVNKPSASANYITAITAINDSNADTVPTFNPSQDINVVKAVVSADTIVGSTSDISTRSSVSINRMLSASLFGRDGYFLCLGIAAADNCNISFNTDGFLEVSYAELLNSGNEIVLYFIPLVGDATLDTHEITFRKSETRTNVTEFAYWGSTNSVADNNDRFTTAVKTFAKSSGFHDLTTEPAELTGRATYNGLAAGYYGKTSDEGFNYGEFTANIELKANFNNDTISGTIDKFSSMAGDNNLSDWTLSLGSVNIDNNDFDATLTGRTTSEDGSKAGKWNAKLLGMANIDKGIKGVVDDMTDNYPEGVVGTFNGHFTNGQVAGAFGTELSAEDKN